MDSQIDHVAGLLSLREGPRLQLYCTPESYEDLTGSLPLLNALEKYCGVTWHPMPLEPGGGAWHEIAGLRLQAVPVPGKAPPYSPRRQTEAPATTPPCSSKTRPPASACSTRQASRRSAMPSARASMLATACWSTAPSGPKTKCSPRAWAPSARPTWATLPQCDGPHGPGMLKALDACAAKRKVLIHINNSNPILDEDGAERAELTRAASRSPSTAWNWRSEQVMRNSTATAAAAAGRMVPAGLRIEPARHGVALPQPPPLQPPAQRG
jgi:pyrroloquinoline quinone biosynthesis protein B